MSFIARHRRRCCAITIALAAAQPQANLYATVLSSDALGIARENARRHGVSRRIAFRRGDLLEPVPSSLDLIVANLPYVKEADLLNLEPELREYEAHLALAAGPDGLSLIRSLLHQAPRYLRPGGAVCLEFGYRQSQAVMFLARAALPAASVSLRHDPTGQPRLLIASLNVLFSYPCSSSRGGSLWRGTGSFSTRAYI